jgi:hypothetical protein
VTGYTDRIRAAVDLGIIPAGAVTQVTVEHSGDCAHHQHRGTPCTCFPLVIAIVNGEALTLGTGGAVLERRKVQ